MQQMMISSAQKLSFAPNNQTLLITQAKTLLNYISSAKQTYLRCCLGT